MRASRIDFLTRLCLSQMPSFSPLACTCRHGHPLQSEPHVFDLTTNKPMLRYAHALHAKHRLNADHRPPFAQPMPVSSAFSENRPVLPQGSISITLLRTTTFLILFPHVPLTGEGLQPSSRVSSTFEHCCALRILHVRMRSLTDIPSTMGFQNLNGTRGHLETFKCFGN